MLFKTPKFWLKKNILAYALLPLGVFYFAITKIINFFSANKKIAKKIICIGNLNIGGSGKTPIAIMIGEILHELNIDFVYLTRGYGSKKQYFGFVKKDKLQSREFGDESLVLADKAPTFIAKNRLLGAQEIAKMQNIEAIILDDGLQNNSIQKDFSIVVIDGKIKFGNEFLFPAGPLREKISGGLKKANLIIVVGEIDVNLSKILQEKKVIKVKIVAKNLNDFSQKKLIAFCGLAYPQKFFEFLEKQDLDLVDKIEFPDHYFYQESDLQKLILQANKMQAKLVTTKKDWVKFLPNFKQQIGFLDIEVAIENQDKQELAKHLTSVIKGL